MKATLQHSKNLVEKATIKVTGSKSESNRLLVLQALYPQCSIANLSQSDDTVALGKGIHIEKGTVDIHHAGTAMRFLTAFFASREGREIVLTGSQRMQERPIGVLVDALKQLGADITYTKNEGFPPLLIKGKQLAQNEVSIQANVSSQYISALMLIAPSLPDGLNILLEGKVTSVPYIEMTLSLLHELGVEGHFSENTISIAPMSAGKSTTITVESDWSSASYFYSIVALSHNLSVTLHSYKRNSLQGDAALSKLYESFGVGTAFNEENATMTLSKSDGELPKSVNFNLVKTPDIAQTIAVTCFGLGMGCTLTGLHTLKIKETDRLVALKNELEKLGATISITDESLELYPRTSIQENVSIATYHDHRMAMAFAPLALRVPISILDSGVVSKSFPTFWEDLSKLGFVINFEE
ncbi:3-phosphoshikimate 1-carboxyvinyltransferase [Aureisphaera galaxeae]|uniref:3-phosphoshikimate 1-carboxyvinyltransferase n=1 Tax=Aureisphaera galaxeae TaxID=1538023 RepID=UPI0023508D93|nr:3-phosphoshikimate 1-carboxyvinyltransferase [Aureisphaera galaxeae]MDC8003177.1 3-phosphoshikimate 1-carboxyvinyltransferase [Aureisphaera galaxeae]